MHTAFDVFYVAVGAAFVLVVLDSALRTFVLPRGVITFISRLVFVQIRHVFDVFAREGRTYAARDRVMALYGPVSLFGLVFVWMAMVIFGFTCIYRGGLGISSWTHAFELSGDAFFTLGFSSVAHGVPSYVLVFIEAATGLGLLTLLIAYLPTIYGAFSRRELAVSKLATRAGTPPSAVQLLSRYQAINWMGDLPALWADWEDWFTDVAETHTSLSVLVFFRSPNPDRSWVTAAGALLDAASIAESTLSIPQSAQARLCIRAGSLALRQIADFYRIPYDPDPPADGPISVARSEFDEAYAALGGAGVAVRPDRERCWRNFAGWRVNYDSVLVGLAGVTMAPYAQWSSDRSLRHRPRVVAPRRPATPK